MKKITLVSDECGEWEGLYIGGKLSTENHSLSGFDVLTALEEAGVLTFTRPELTTGGEEALVNDGCFPPDEKDLMVKL